MKRQIPWLMVIVRALLGPVMVFGAHVSWPGWLLAAIVLFALFDDIVDGMLARRWDCDTPKMRLADSTADTIFYLGVAVALWLRVPHLLRANAWPLTTLFVLEGLRYLFDFAKFRKAASYHSYLAKAWGLTLTSAVVTVLLFGRAWAITAAIFIGIVTNLEGFTMSLLLPHWQNDVKTIKAALRIRASAKQATSAAPQSPPPSF